MTSLWKPFMDALTEYPLISKSIVMLMNNYGSMNFKSFFVNGSDQFL